VVHLGSPFHKYSSLTSRKQFKCFANGFCSHTNFSSVSHGMHTACTYSPACTECRGTISVMDRESQDIQLCSLRGTGALWSWSGVRLCMIFAVLWRFCPISGNFPVFDGHGWGLIMCTGVKHCDFKRAPVKVAWHQSKSRILTRISTHFSRGVVRSAQYDRHACRRTRDCCFGPALSVVRASVDQHTVAVRHSSAVFYHVCRHDAIMALWTGLQHYHWTH